MNQALNPYRPPTAEVQLAAEDTAAPLEIAGKGRRFCTWIVDYVGFVALIMIIVFVLALVFGPNVVRQLQGGWSYLLSFVVFMGYYVFFEGVWGRTPGKLILGTVVTDLQGRHPAFGNIVGRTLARFMPFEGFTFFGERGFHDRVSKTLVIRKR